MAKSVRIILMQDVPNLGRRGDIVSVKPGYARNYLIPQGLAQVATKGLIKLSAGIRRTRQRQAEQERNSALAVKDAIEALTVTISRPAGRDDLLHEAITSEVIATWLADHNITIDRRQIELTQPLKRAGHYTVTVHLFEDIRAQLRVNIEPEGSQVESPA